MLFCSNFEFDLINTLLGKSGNEEPCSGDICDILHFLVGVHNKYGDREILWCYMINGRIMMQARLTALLIMNSLITSADSD